MKSIRTFLLFSLLLSGLSVTSQILYSNNFSSSLGTATISGGSSGNWIWVNNCTQSTAGGHTAPGSALFQGSSCQFGNGSNTVAGDLTTPSIPIGSSGAVLTFNYFLSTECQNPGNSCFYDVLSLLISNNGGTSWTTIMASSGTPVGLVNTGTWLPVTFNLNPYSNSNILIRFNFNSIDGIGNAYDGVYVDDITVTGNCFISLTTLPGNSTVTPVICAGQSVTLTTNAVSNYSWNTGASTQSIVVSPTVSTQYAVIATSSANCSSSNTLSVTVNPALPTLSVINTASLGSGTCPNSTVMLTASGANSYTWVSTSIPVTNGLAFSPTTTASYTVTGGNACGTVSTALSISVHPVPTVSAVVSQPTVCSGNIPVTLTGIGSAISYTWNGTLANGSNIFPTVTMNHTVIGSSALGCTASAIAPVTVVTTPLAPIITNPPLICIGSSATLSSSGANVYTWITPTGTLGGQQIVVSPLANTIYTLTKSNANCINTSTATLFVNLLPSVFAITSPTIICASTTATLSAGGAQTYTWTSPSFSVSGSSPVVSPSVTTIYTVAASDGTCVNTTTVSLATNPNPTITVAASSTNICQGDVVNLSANGALGYTWTAGATSNTNAASIAESPIAPTLYQVTGNNNFNCTSNAQVVVLVRTTPTLNIGTNKPLVCAGAPSGLTVTAQAGPCTYTWGPLAGSATSSVVIVNPLTNTTYSVLGLAPNGCTATASFPVSVFFPTFAVNSPTSSCLGGTITLMASGANTYTWNGNQPFSQISVSPSGPTLYIVAATSSSSNVNCVSTNTVFVTIYNNPTVTAVPSRTQICRGEFTDINGGGALTYTLNTGLAGSVIPVNPVNNTTYTLTGTDGNGCVGATTVQVRISTCFGITEFDLASRIGLKVFPNPNNGIFNITANQNASIVLENELGQNLGEYELNAFNNYQASVKGLSQGVYFITVIQNSERISQKIVVSH